MAWAGLSGEQPAARAARHARKEPRRSRSRKVTRSGAAARAPYDRRRDQDGPGAGGRIGGTPVKYGDPKGQQVRGLADTQASRV